MSSCTPETAAPAPPGCLVWVVDDDRVLVDYLVDVIAHAGVEVRGLDDPAAMLDAFDRGAPELPQVLLCDLQMPGIDGIELVRLLRSRGFHHPSILMSAHLDVARTIEAMREGLFDVVTKPIDAESLLQEIEKAIKAARTAHAERADAALRAGRIAALTQRELEVLGGLSRGLMNKQVADLLKVSIKTVETHRQHIMQKTALRTAAELMSFAIEWRMLQRRE